MIDDEHTWLSPETAPINGDAFWGKLSNGETRIVWATWMVRRAGQRKARFAYWGTNTDPRVPYVPSHPEGIDWGDTPLLIGWQPF